MLKIARRLRLSNCLSNKMAGSLPMLATLALISAVSSTSVYSQDLLETYTLAVQHDPTLSSARYGNTAAQEKLEQGKALYRPVVSFRANANHSNTDIQYVGSDNVFRNGGREKFDTYDYSVNVNQPIFRKQNDAQYAQAESQVAQADLQLKATEQELISRTCQAYFDVLLAQDNIALLAAQRKAIQQQYAQAKGNFDAGVATITDVYDAQAKNDLVVAQEIAAQNILQAKLRALEAITAVRSQTLAPVATIDDLKVFPSDSLEHWLELAEQHNPNLNLQVQNLAIASAEVDKQRAGRLPTLDAVGSYVDSRANNGINGFGTNLQNATVGLQLQIPLYQGGAVSSKIREAVANQMKAQEDVEAARRKASLDASQFYLDMQSSLSQISAYTQAVLSGQAQLDATNKGYQVGLRTSVDILNAQQQLFTAKRDLLQARYNNILNAIKLRAVAGQLSLDDITLINSRLASAN